MIPTNREYLDVVSFRILFASRIRAHVQDLWDTDAASMLFPTLEGLELNRLFYNFFPFFSLLLRQYKEEFVPFPSINTLSMVRL